VHRYALLATLATVACTEEPWPTTGTRETERFHSAKVDDDYVLRLRLPPGYDPDGATKYPLVVQMDPTYAGLQELDITSGLVSQHAADGDLPEAIVLGVDYPDPTTRERDYDVPADPDPAFESGGADRFYATLRDEILPHVEAEHAIDPMRRVLLGHSNGAVFAWYVAFRHEDGTPPLFAGIVAADNGYDQQLFTLERWHAERATDLPLRMYVTHAMYNGAAQKRGFDWMRERLEGRDYPGLELEMHELETDHKGAIWPSFEDGLAFTLGGAR
jgi:predicted peptidase